MSLGGRLNGGYMLKEITVIAENAPGSLHAVASAVAKSGINIEAINAYARNADEAMFRIITTDPYSTKKALESVKYVKEIRENDIIVLKLPNRPGELAKITERLYKNGIDLESVYIIGKTDDITEVAIKPYSNMVDKAKEILM